MGLIYLHHVETWIAKGEDSFLRTVEGWLGECVWVWSAFRTRLRSLGFIHRRREPVDF